MNKIFGSVALAVLLAAGTAQAQSPGVHTHDGFYLQMDLGFGWMGSSAEDDAGTELKFTGGAGQFGVALGAALTPNFLIGGSFWGTTIPDPTVELNGTDLGEADATLTLSGFGVHLAYYFTPVNVYLSATPSITQLSLDDGNSSSETEWGFGMKFAVGKEWWVSDNWAIGLNGQFAFSSNEDKGTGAPTWGTTWFGVAFSATYD